MTALLFSVVFLIYLPFVHGDVAWLDGGHLTAAAAELGVPHATGFPLFIIGGHGLSLIPLGSIAFKVALLSSLAISGATALIFTIARQNGAKAWPAFLGALIFPLTFTVWVNGQLAEVYALNAFFIALLATLLWRDEPKLKLALFVTGLGLGSHATFVGAAAVMWVAIAIGHRPWRQVLSGCHFFLIGALIIFLLPVAAGREPFLNWGGGEVATMGGLWDHLTAQGIRDSFASEMGSQSHAEFQVATWMGLAGGSLFPVLLALCVMSGLWLRNRGVWLAMLGVLAFDMLFSAFVNPMGQLDLQTGIPGALMLAIGVACCAGLAARDEQAAPRWLKALQIACLAGLCGIQALERWEDRPADALAGAHGRLALNDALPDATIFATGDNLPGPSLYLQGVEGLRRDVLLVVSQHVAHTPTVSYAYEKAGRDVPAAFAAKEPRDLWGRMETLIDGDTLARPIYWRLGVAPFDARMRSRLTPGPLLHRVFGGVDPKRCPSSRVNQTLGARLNALRVPRFRTHRELSELSRLNALWCVLAGQHERGLDLAKHAAKIDSTNPRGLTLLGTLQGRAGRMKEAESLLRQSVALDPTYAKAAELLRKYFGDSKQPHLE